MKLACEFAIQKVMGRYAAVPLGDVDLSINKILSLNESGKRVFELLNEGKQEEEIVAAILEEYPEDGLEHIRQAVKGYLDRIREMGLLIG